jgi:opacity protein-like surface antigen
MARTKTRTRTIAFVVAVVAALALAAPARAADAPAGWSVPADFGKTLPRFGEYKSGWYLRGDIGYRYNRVGGVSSADAVTSHDYDNTVAFTGGVGIKRDWFRSDVTVDYAPQAKFNGTTANALATQPQYAAKIDTTSVLANVYLDLGTWGGFTPYVGAGAGLSYLRSGDYADTTLPAGELVPVATRWDFSWAAMAGLSFQVTPRWTVDVGYRYLKFGNAISGRDSQDRFTTFQNLSTQEVRVGVRFLLD